MKKGKHPWLAGFRLQYPISFSWTRDWAQAQNPVLGAETSLLLETFQTGSQQKKKKKPTTHTHTHIAFSVGFRARACIFSLSL